jgi:hypothetical protein
VIEDIYAPQLWRRMGWGLASPRADKVLKMLLPGVHDPDERRRIALDHQAKCLKRARRFAGALDKPGAPPTGTTIHLFAGDAVDTLAVLDARADGRVHINKKQPGDGTVLRTSALMDERVGGDWHPMLVTPITFTSAHFVFTDHLGMTRDVAFSDNVLHCCWKRLNDDT